MKNSTIKLAVIFDMDGVLIDSVTYHWQAMNQVLAEYNVHVPDDRLRNYIGQSVYQQLSQISDDFEAPLNIDDIVRKIKPIKQKLQEGIQPKEGVVDFLDLLAKQSIPTAVGTSSMRTDATRKLRDAGLYDRFQTIVTHDDVVTHKPDPKVYLVAAQEIDVLPDHCIVIEDAPSGIEAAKRAGMKCIAVKTLYTTVDDLQSADYVVNSLSEITMVLMNDL